MVAGSANISQPNGQTLNINQSTDRATINWRGFSINVNELVRFTQPSSRSIVLNRVTGVDPSSILGRLIANGRVFVVNPNGVFFGPNSVVDVAGLLATTFTIRDSDFMAGRFNFAQDPAKQPAYVINNGQIKVSDNGFVFLVAPGFANNGLIIANLGKVVMGSGETLTVDFMGDGLINFAIEGKVLDQVRGPDGTPLTSAVSNSGTIRADGGQVVLTARTASEIFSSVVNNSGVIEARSLVNRGGVIRLEGSDPVANTGEIGWQANRGRVQNAEGAVINTGTLDVSAAEAGAAQGEITLSGQMVGSSGSILARGVDNAQGGNVLITSSDNTVLTRNSLVNTSGVDNSSAGNVVVWSDKDTVFRGTILAKGGETGGNGGQVEVSGHENLLFAGSVNTLAPNGTVGTVLLDPATLTIIDAGAGSGTQDANLSADNQILFGDPNIGANTVSWGTIDSLAATANVALEATGAITINNVTGAAGGTTTANNLVMLDLTTGSLRITSTGGAVTFSDTNDTIRTEGGAITLQALGGALTAGNLNTTGAGGGTSGNVSLDADTNITVDNVTTGGGTFTARADFDVNGSGTFTVPAARTISTSGGVISITTDDITLTGTLNSGAGATTILSSNTQTIGVGAAGGGMTISGAELQNITATGLTIGNATNSNITVNGVTAAQSQNIAGMVTLNAIGPTRSVNFSGAPSTFNALALMLEMASMSTST